MWTAMHQDHAKIGTKRINDPSRHNCLLIHVVAEAIQDGHTGPTKLAVVPAPNEGANVFAPVLKFNATLAMTLCRSEDLVQNEEVHAVEDD